MATIRDLDRRIKDLEGYSELVDKLIKASMESSPEHPVMQKILESKSPEFGLNGLSNTLIVYKAFLTELRDTTPIVETIPTKLVSKLI